MSVTDENTFLLNTSWNPSQALSVHLFYLFTNRWLPIGVWLISQHVPLTCLHKKNCEGLFKRHRLSNENSCLHKGTERIKACLECDGLTICLSKKYCYLSKNCTLKMFDSSAFITVILPKLIYVKTMKNFVTLKR